MKNLYSIVFIALMLSIASCNMEKADVDNKVDDFTGEVASFYPMEIGNYWRIDSFNYKQVVDTARISGNLFYKFNSLIGGDAISIQYLRIDENQDLLESYPDGNQEAVIAKFSAELNDEFFTLEDGSLNDLKVRVIAKSENRIAFEYQMIHHPNLNKDKYTVTYIKGLGPKEAWKEVRINGKVYSF